MPFSLTFLYNHLLLVLMPDFDFAPVEQVVDSLMIHMTMTNDVRIQLIGRGELSLDDLRFEVTRTALTSHLYVLSDMDSGKPASEAKQRVLFDAVNLNATMLMSEHYGLTPEEYKRKMADIVGRMALYLPGFYSPGIDY